MLFSRVLGVVNYGFDVMFGKELRSIYDLIKYSICIFIFWEVVFIGFNKSSEVGESVGSRMLSEN